MARKPILCLDFDGVVHSYTSGWQGARNIPDPPMPGALDFMLEALEAGWDVVIHSSRARYFGGMRAMRRWLRNHACDRDDWDRDQWGLSSLMDVRFARSKPPAVLTIDDRAMTFRGDWPSIQALRDFKPWRLGG